MINLHHSGVQCVLPVTYSCDWCYAKSNRIIRFAEYSHDGFLNREFMVFEIALALRLIDCKIRVLFVFLSGFQKEISTNCNSTDSSQY